MQNVTPGLRKLVLAFTVMSLTVSCVPVGAPATSGKPEVSLGEGIALLSQRRFDEAKAVFARLSPWKNGDPRVLMGIAIASDMKGDFRTADRAYDELLLRGDLNKASSYLKEAARRDPDNAAIKNNLKMLRGVMPIQ